MNEICNYGRHENHFRILFRVVKKSHRDVTRQNYWGWHTNTVLHDMEYVILIHFKIDLYIIIKRKRIRSIQMVEPS
jgi:hypothetical protein